ncbi:hypothetical protein GWQ22_20740, partial [Aeromonas sp. 1HA1]|nr:hypothetical protein [Aeromonas sp. 1HA1]
MVTSVSVRATIIDDNTGIKTQLPIVLTLTLIHKYCELIGTFPDFQDLISYVTPEHGNDHANFCSSSCGR